MASSNPNLLSTFHWKLKLSYLFLFPSKLFEISHIFQSVLQKKFEFFFNLVIHFIK